jgi:hypothetical protein
MTNNSSVVDKQSSLESSSTRGLHNDRPNTKRAENHGHSVAIGFMHHNFVRIHQSLRITPAMAAGVTTKLW